MPARSQSSWNYIISGNISEIINVFLIVIYAIEKKGVHFSSDRVASKIGDWLARSKARLKILLMFISVINWWSESIVVEWVSPMACASISSEAENTFILAHMPLCNVMAVQAIEKVFSILCHRHDITYRNDLNSNIASLSIQTAKFRRRAFIFNSLYIWPLLFAVGFCILS